MATVGGLAGLGGYDSAPADGISALYRDILGRDADAGGLDYWLNHYQSGLSLDDIANAFAASPEAMAYRAGGGGEIGATPTGFGEYGPSPSAIPGVDDADYWRRQYIGDLYSAFGFDADPAGADYWAGSGLDYDGLYNAFMEAPGVRENVIGDLYQSFLGRTPGDDEVSYWSANWSDYPTIMQAFADSDEAKIYSASMDEQFGPWQPWMTPLAPSPEGQTRNNAQIMAEILLPHFGPANTAAILGNMVEEGRLGADTLQWGVRDGQRVPLFYGENPRSRLAAPGFPLGFGTMQYNPDRLQQLMQFGDTYGFDWATPEAQARYTIYDMMKTPMFRGLANRMRQMQGSDSPEDLRRATQDFMRQYLRPKSNSSLPKRLMYGQQILDWLGLGMPSDDSRIENMMRRPEIGPIPPNADPRFDFLRPGIPTEPGFRDDPYMYPDTSGSWDGPQSMGPYIDPLTGQWRDPMMESIYGGLQPTLVSTPDPWVTSWLGGSGYQSTPSFSSSGSQIGFGTPTNQLNDPFGQTGGWGTYFDPVGPSWQPTFFDYSIPMS